MSEWCGIESLYLSLNAPNPKNGEPTLPALLSPDPENGFFRVLVPTVLLPLTLVAVFLGRLYPTIYFSFIGSGAGFAVAQGALFGRPKYFPVDVSCGAQYAASIGGVLGGLLMGFAIHVAFNPLKSFVLGGLAAFVVFQQFPSLDSIVTGYAAMDNMKGSFLGWGFFAWLVTAVSSIIAFAFMCWPRLREAVDTFVVSLAGSWAVTQSIRLILRNQTTLEDAIPIGWSIAILIGSFVVLQVLQICLLVRLIHKRHLRENLPIPFSSSIPNTVRRVNR